MIYPKKYGLNDHYLINVAYSNSQTAFIFKPHLFILPTLSVASSHNVVMHCKMMKCLMPYQL